MSSTLFYDTNDDDVLNVAYYIEHNISALYISKGHVFEILILSICCVGLNFILHAFNLISVKSPANITL